MSGVRDWRRLPKSHRTDLRPHDREHFRTSHEVFKADMHPESPPLPETATTGVRFPPLAVRHSKQKVASLHATVRASLQPQLNSTSFDPSCSSLSRNQRVLSRRWLTPEPFSDPQSSMYLHHFELYLTPLMVRSLAQVQPIALCIRARDTFDPAQRHRVLR